MVPVHPVIQRVIKCAYRRNHGDLPSKTVEEVRQYYRYRLLFCPAPCEEVQIQGAGIRLHRPEHLKNAPLVIYLRASAYVMGQGSDSDLFCYYLAQYLNCVVASIEPRLAPEYKFPTAFEDCIACIEYLYNQAAVLHIDSDKVAIWGESSGGNLAAAISQHLKAQNWIKYQVLFYPMLDYYHDYPSKKFEGYLMDTPLRNWFINQYVGTQKDYQDIRFSPLLAADVSGLPTTLLINAQYDPLRDEAMHYFNRLVQAQVPVFGWSMPGLIHGFLLYVDKVEPARFALQNAMDFLQQQFQAGG